MISPLENTRRVQGNWIASPHAPINPEIASHERRGESPALPVSLLMLTRSRKALLRHFFGGQTTSPHWMKQEKTPNPPNKPAAAGKRSLMHLTSIEMISAGPHRGTNPLTPSPGDGTAGVKTSLGILQCDGGEPRGRPRVFSVRRGVRSRRGEHPANCRGSK